MKIKNIKRLFIIIAIALILILAVVFLVFGNVLKGNKKATETITNVDGVITINSTKNAPIEKDGIEVTKIEIVEEKLDITVKNNSKEVLEGFFITLMLTDKDGKDLEVISYNSADTIEPKKDITFDYYITNFNTKDKITGVKIYELEKGNAKKSLDDTFNDLVE